VQTEDIPCPHLVKKIQPKTWTSPLIGTCPKTLFCQKHQGGSLEFTPKAHRNILG